MKYNKLEKYIKEAETDFILENDKLTLYMFNLPMLHSKWMGYYFRESILLESKTIELKKLYKSKYVYYLKDYDLQVKETKIDYFIEGDEEFSLLSLKVSALKKTVQFLEMQVKRCANMTFIHKNIIDLEKFKNGIV